MLKADIADDHGFDKATSEDALGRSSGSSSTRAVCSRNSLTPEQQRQQALAERFIGLAKSAAAKVKQKLYQQKLLRPGDAAEDEIESNAMTALMELIVDTSESDTVAYYFQIALNELFVKHEVQRVQRQRQKQAKSRSLYTATGRLRQDFADDRPSWSEAAILDAVDCPHSELAKRIFIFGEAVEDVLPDPADRRHWYRVQKPEIRRYFAKLYPEWEEAAARREQL